MTRISVTREKRLLEDPGKEKFGSDGERRTIAWSTESTHDEREERINGRSTKDIRAPPIVVLVISRALFCDFLVFVLFDLFDFDGSFLILTGEKRVSGLQRRCVNSQKAYLLVLSTVTSRVSIRHVD